MRTHTRKRTAPGIDYKWRRRYWNGQAIIPFVDLNFDEGMLLHVLRRDLKRRPDHPKRLLALGYLIRYYQRQGNLSKAIARVNELLIGVHADQRRVVPDSEWTKAIMMATEVLDEANLEDESEDWFLELLSAAKVAEDMSPGALVQAMWHYSMHLCNLNRLDAARHLAHDTFNYAQTHIPSYLNYLARSCGILCHVYNKSEDLEQASLWKENEITFLKQAGAKPETIVDAMMDLWSLELPQRNGYRALIAWTCAERIRRRQNPPLSGQVDLNIPALVYLALGQESLLSFKQSSHFVDLRRSRRRLTRAHQLFSRLATADLESMQRCLNYLAEVCEILGLRADADSYRMQLAMVNARSILESGGPSSSD